MSKRQFGNLFGNSFSSNNLSLQRGLIVGLILFVALIAFEIFNFDTTKFALESLLGNVTFMGIHWAAILAVAFCAIDFAGLNRLFSSGDNKETREVWYLMGAWLLGATMNAVMTWWAVSLTLLNNNFGNEVLSRDQLLHYVPIFVAVLVWLTRILFIGSLSIAGDHLFRNNNSNSNSRQSPPPRTSQTSPVQRRQAAPQRIKAAPKPISSSDIDQPIFSNHDTVSTPQPQQSVNNSRPQSRSSRVRQRPPIPNNGVNRTSSRIQASQRR